MGFSITHYGRAFDPEKCDHHTIYFPDIAKSLANKVRYNGHAWGHYSVAEHCCHLYDCFASPDLKMQALMHDACEAYLPDVPGPYKHLLPDFLALEDKISRAIATKYGYEYPFHDVVTKYDSLICNNELLELFPYHPPELKIKAEDCVAGVKIQCWDAERAEREFTKRAVEIGIVVGC